MSDIRAVSQCDAAGDVIVSLSVPRDVLTELNERIDDLDEQQGTKIRDRSLEVLAAMVIQSLDEFRQSDMFKLHRRIPPGESVGEVTFFPEGTVNDDEG